ncbi:L,D-transpeptidase family protein [Clostridium prolinivorans]|uniref:L,D-transpeptidase family protein n=1 Tax=Clostridium prolinivorans TaxID=2769420 RepID=UPI000FDA29DC|nr:L,D-transpeptidase family protein [Clostridium prolinivorans]
MEIVVKKLKKLKVGPVKNLIKKLKENLTKENIKKIIKKLKEKLKEHKKLALTISILLGGLIFIYFSLSIYFINHFYFGSKINGINVSGKSVNKANEIIKAEINKYVLNLKEKDGKEEQIKSSEIGLRCNPNEDFKKLKNIQSPLKWGADIFNKEKREIEINLHYDKKLLEDRINKLNCLNDNIIEPKNASLKYENNKYIIVKEVMGNKIDKSVLYKNIETSIIKGKTVIDLENTNCYIKPQYTSNSQKVIEARDILNKYVSSNITYLFGEQKEVIDCNIINKWLVVDENFEVKINEKELKKYIDMISNKYNTVGKKRDFLTSSGKVIKIGGGDYGWAINKSKEIEDLIKIIKDGQTVTKKPTYKQTAAVYGQNDIGNTYVEIDLTKQHLWFYKNGSLVVDGDVVTGNVRKKNTTPPGIYRLKYKQRNATLKGEDYVTPVDFWMPFNGGIGIHDAKWRSKFGGEIYKTNGSHGCINSPYYLAKTIYENIQVGTPVVCYN